MREGQGVRNTSGVQADVCSGEVTAAGILTAYIKNPKAIYCNQQEISVWRISCKWRSPRLQPQFLITLPVKRAGL